jgi:hypothetical protein
MWTQERGKRMNLGDYFKGKQGYGVLATADSGGMVDAAVYAAPYVVGEDRVAFIVADRLSRKNLLSNPHAAYLFLETGGGYAGKRLFLTMEKEANEGEIKEAELVEKFRKAVEEYSQETLSVMYFKVDKVLPLVVEK